MQRKYLLGVVAVLVVAGSLLAAYKTHAPVAEPQTPEAQYASSSESVSSSTSDVAAPAATQTPEPSSQPQLAIASQVTAQSAQKSTAPTTLDARSTATLSVEGTNYALTSPEGSTLKEAMDTLQNESSFTYAYRNYAGLGAFVTEINGSTGGDKYWILYVNGEKSASGISSTHIRSGDVIEWKLEKSY